MLSIPAEIDCYEKIRALSAEMVGVARSGDWDRLAELGSQVGALRDALMANSDSGPDAVTNTPEAGRKRELIRQILADDAEIRRHVLPWMADVREFLDSQNHRRRLQQAYAITDSVPGQDAQGGAQGGLSA